MRGPAKAVKTPVIGVGIKPEHLDATNASDGKAAGDIAFQIKLEMVRPSCGKEAFIFRIMFEKAAREPRINLVRRPRDARSNGGGDPISRGTQCDHGVDGSIGHAAYRALPPGVRCPDNPGLGIGKQHRRAISGQDAEQQPRPVRYHRISVRTLLKGDGAHDRHNIRRMHLMYGDKFCPQQNRFRGAAPVFEHRVPVIVGPDTDVQACVNAGGDASATAKKAMWHWRKGSGGENFNLLICHLKLRSP
jgi:hypothetical protein